MPFDEINREFSFPLQKIIDEYKLEVIYMPDDGGNTLISDHEINRPGLQFAGFYEYFDKQRIQVMGRTEHSYLSTLEPNVRRERIDNLLSYKFPALIITRDLDVFPELVESAKEHETTLLRTDESSSVFTSKLVNFLNLQLAPRITRHGVLIEIYGEGVLILGESGVGKSETAIELVKRGHRLIADDAVEIKKASNITLVGSSPDNIRHFLELRGIGIINARQLFGVGAVKLNEKIDMVVELELWNPEKTYDRMGVDTIIIGRGGGSREDLEVFDDEAVVRAIYEAKTPIISGTGHEGDTSLADDAADLRVETPTAAATAAVPLIDDILRTIELRLRTMNYHVANKKQNYQTRLDSCERELRLRMQGRLQEKETKLQMYMQQLAALNPRAKLEKQQEKLKQSRERLENRIQLKFKEYEHQLHLLLTRLHGNAPTAKLVGGFGYLESEGKPVMSAGQMQAGDPLHVTLHDGRIHATVVSVEADTNGVQGE